jgi:glycosyltransferase involved in cell wall biosynthesis
MQIGLPVICSDIPATRDLAGDAGRLMIVEEGNARSFADALRELADNDVERSRMALQSAAWARETLDAKKSIQAHIEEYERILSHR